MATWIRTKTANQAAALKAAFGWESYPSGSSGYGDKVVGVLSKHGALKSYDGFWGHGCEPSGRAIDYWPSSLITELKTLAEARGKLDGFPWSTIQ